MIKIKLQNGLVCPKFVCDACGKIITDYSMAVYCYQFVDSAEILVLHKDVCMDTYENLLDKFNQTMGWDELDILATRLFSNNENITAYDINNLYDLMESISYKG